MSANVLQNGLDHNVKIDYLVVQVKVIVITEDHVLVMMCAHVIKDILEKVAKQKIVVNQKTVMVTENVMMVNVNVLKENLLVRPVVLNVKIQDLIVKIYKRRIIFVMIEDIDIMQLCV